MITAEVSGQEQWGIEEATKNFNFRKDYWKVAFKEGFNVDQQVFEKNFGQKYPENIMQDMTCPSLYPVDTN